MVGWVGRSVEVVYIQGVGPTRVVSFLIICGVVLVLVFAALGCRSKTAAKRSWVTTDMSKKRRHMGAGFEAEAAWVAKDDAGWLERLHVSEAEVARIRSFPQRNSTGRASPEWLRFRRHRLTASRFRKASSSVSNEGRRSDMELCRLQVIEEMLTQPEASTSPQRFGVANEAVARQSYVGFRMRGRDTVARERFSVEETGLCVWREEPWLAASPDGIVWDDDSVGALEIKCCPKAMRMYSIESIAPEFYDQMQGGMAILSSVLQREVSWCDFFVWSPGQRRCRRVLFDGDYFYNELLPKLRVFYFGCYVLVAKRVPLGASGPQLQRCARKLAKRDLKDRRRDCSDTKYRAVATYPMTLAPIPDSANALAPLHGLLCCG